MAGKREHGIEEGEAEPGGIKQQQGREQIQQGGEQRQQSGGLMSAAIGKAGEQGDQRHQKQQDRHGGIAVKDRKRHQKIIDGQHEGKEEQTLTGGRS